MCDKKHFFYTHRTEGEKSDFIHEYMVSDIFSEPSTHLKIKCYYTLVSISKRKTENDDTSNNNKVKKLTSEIVVRWSDIAKKETM